MGSVKTSSMGHILLQVFLKPRPPMPLFNLILCLRMLFILIHSETGMGWKNGTVTIPGYLRGLKKGNRCKAIQ